MIPAKIFLSVRKTNWVSRLRALRGSTNVEIAEKSVLAITNKPSIKTIDLISISVGIDYKFVPLCFS